MEVTQHTPADMRERLDVPGLPDGITPLTGVFTTHHAGRPHAIVLWQGAPWLVWQHPDGNWVTEAKVQVAALLRTPRGEEEAWPGDAENDASFLRSWARYLRTEAQDIRDAQDRTDWKQQAEYTEVAAARMDQIANRIAALRSEAPGEAWRAFLDTLDEFEAAANLWVDPEGPTADDMARLDRARQRVIECGRALAGLRFEAQGDGPVGAVCANCGAPNAAIAGGELDPDEAVCSVECYEQLMELGCPQEHGGTYRPQPARRGEGGSNGLE